MKNKTKFKETEIGKIPEEWEVDNLFNICVDEDGIQTGPFGSQLHEKDYVKFGAPIITVEHLGENKIIHEDMPMVSDKDKQRLAKYTLKEGDIVFSRVGSVDRRAIVKKEENGWLFSGRCLRVRANEKKINPLFLSYYFGLDGFKERIKNHAVGATMPSLNTKILSEIKVIIPPYADQKAIAKILSDLDSKIELNNQMNRTLEAAAQALFKRWFVDFEFPNENGKPYKSSGGKMIWSEELQKKVPAEWSIRRFGDVMDVYGGSTPSTKNQMFWNGDVNWITPKEITQSGKIFFSETERKITKDGLAAIGSRLIPKESILLTSRAPVGFVGMNKTEMAVNQGMIGAKTHKEFSQFFMFFWLKNNTPTLLNYSNGSTFGELSKTTFRNLQFQCPPYELLQHFDKNVSAIFEQIAKNENQNKTLIQIRDSLLPKLMSGQIRVSVI